MSVPGRRRELFVWYRVEARSATAARDAVQAMQRTLADRFPGLQARLLTRGDGGAVQTWMETYARAVDDGASRDLDDELARAVATASPALAAVIEGERHVEAFDVVDDNTTSTSKAS